MAGIDRLTALCSQEPQSAGNPFGIAFTGIDFIQVVEPKVQDRLRVFFVVEPTTLNTPLVQDGALAPLPANPTIGAAGLPGVDTGVGVHIQSEETGAAVEVISALWMRIAAPAGERVALEVTVAGPGDFSYHSLTIEDDRVDPFFNGTRFSFKQGCPSVFDCQEDCTPAPVESIDYPVDYLARDFWSLRRALLDFAAARYPGWSEPLEADEAVMLMEIMAALGDEFAYTQDRYAREATLPTATQRRSRSALARLVDYHPDPGVAAETELAVWLENGGTTCETGARAWALPEGRDPIPFSAIAPVWLHAGWNEIALHCPDSDVRCLPEGATEAFLLTDAPTIAQLPPSEVLAPEAFWVGRRVVLRAVPSDPSDPKRAFGATITAVERLTDSLAPVTGTPTPITRISWDTPTPWPLPLSETSALLNIVPVRAGEDVAEVFRVGSDAVFEAKYAALSPTERGKLRALPRAIEREGPLAADSDGRGRLLRYGLRASETRGLGWVHPADATGLSGQRVRTPLLDLVEVEPNGLDAASQLQFSEDAEGAAWTFLRDILSGDLNQPLFTLEEGMWRTVATHRRPFETDFDFGDYAGDAGWTLRFGDGYFGRPPEDGTIFRLRYTTAPGSAANLSPSSVTHLSPPVDLNDPQAVDPTTATDFIAFATAVSNPLAITSGSDEEASADIRTSAPEAFRARPLRAVRPEDFREILERIDWVQRANATVRWTGSWATYFVAADPLNGFALNAAEKRQLQDEIDCIRQATRDARASDPDYVDIDLEIEICARADAYPGEVAERVTSALSAPGFFAPRNFTFGQALARSGLEAAIQAVPGVKGIEDIRIRERRRRDWHSFTEPELAVEPWQIVRLQNDPQFPGRGSLSVMAHGGAP